MRNGVFLAISVNQDGKVISFQPSRVLRKEEYTPGLTAIRLEPLPKVSLEGTQDGNSGGMPASHVTLNQPPTPTHRAARGGSG